MARSSEDPLFELARIVGGRARHTDIPLPTLTSPINLYPPGVEAMLDELLRSPEEAYDLSILERAQWVLSRHHHIPPF